MHGTPPNETPHQRNTREPEMVATFLKVNKKSQNLRKQMQTNVDFLIFLIFLSWDRWERKSLRARKKSISDATQNAQEKCSSFWLELKIGLFFGVRVNQPKRFKNRVPATTQITPHICSVAGCVHLQKQPSAHPGPAKSPPSVAILQPSGKQQARGRSALHFSPSGLFS